VRANPDPVPHDTIEDVQLRGVSRWSPRRAGLPQLADWWPSYFLLAALALLVVLLTARTLVEVLTPFAHVFVIGGVAAVLTFALQPVVMRMEEWMPRTTAAVLVFLGTLLVISTFALLLVWQLAAEGQRFSDRLTEFADALEGRRPLSIGDWSVPFNIQERVRDIAQTQGPKIAESSATLAGAFVSFVIDLVLTLVITFYLLIDAERLRVAALRALGPRRRPVVRRVFDEVARVFGAYVRAQLIVAISVGILVAIAMFLVGVPYALFLGLFASVAELIPMLGPLIASIPAVLVALTQPFPIVLWAAIALLVIQQVEQNFLLPRLSGHAVGIHPIGSILALIFGFEVGGPIGALFAVPIAGLLWVVLSTSFGAWRSRRVDLGHRLRRARRARRRAAAAGRIEGAAAQPR